MLLKSISYIGDCNRISEWSYSGLELQDINLIVGYNASGKTRTLESIKVIAGLLSGELKLRSSFEKFKLILSDNGEEYLYELHVENGEVSSEKLSIDGNVFLNRSEEKGINYIFSNQLEKNLEFSIEKNELAVIGKRDKIQHSYLEKLIKWGEHTVHYPFGTEMGRKSLLVVDYDEQDTNYSDKRKTKMLRYKSPSAVTGYLKYGLEKYGKEFIEAVTKQMDEIGYDIEEIGIGNVDLDESNETHQGIFVKESDLKSKTYQYKISQGMFRALSIIIHTTMCVKEDRASLILIDDIGEGLDYNRSTSLIKLLINKAKKSKIQLIMTTNDRFVMNNVDLEYWQVVQRNNGNCKYYNYSNSKQIFDDFKFIGLSNFDFLSSEFFSMQIKDSVL